MRPIFRPIREVSKVDSEEMKVCRALGVHYGDRFALPMCLAYLCRKARDKHLFRGGVEDLHIILDGIQGLPIPLEWRWDNKTPSEVWYTMRFGDVEQLSRLIRALSDHSKREERLNRSREGFLRKLMDVTKSRYLERLKRKQHLQDSYESNVEACEGD